MFPWDYYSSSGESANEIFGREKNLQNLTNWRHLLTLESPLSPSNKLISSVKMKIFKLRTQKLLSTNKFSHLSDLGFCLIQLSSRAFVCYLWKSEQRGVLKVQYYFQMGGKWMILIRFFPYRHCFWGSKNC